MTTPSKDHVFPPPPVTCPRCGQETGLMILRGFPSARAERAIAARQVIHRGCMVSPDDDDWACTNCGHEWRDDA